jgi:hypothetical protein
MKTFNLLLNEDEVKSILTAIDSRYAELDEALDYLTEGNDVHNMASDVVSEMEYYDKFAKRLENLLK